MASLTLLLLHLLLMVSAGSAWYSNYRSFGGSLTFTPKGQNSDGTYNVELHNTQTTRYCYLNGYWCSSGNCGTSIQQTNTIVSRNSWSFNWCQYNVVNKVKLNSNLPFEIRFPTHRSSYYGQGYWISNFRGSWSSWRMKAHVDLGTRSDTGEANKSPITTILPTLRVTRNCPRSFNITVFDPDGDRVRCRIPSVFPECGQCVLPEEFSLDQDSCSIQYRPSTRSGYLPIELMVEDYPHRPITLSYSDRSYTVKRPLSAGRRKREAWSFTTTPAPNTAEPTTPEPTPIDETTPEPTPVDESIPEPTPVDENTPEPTPIDETIPEPTIPEPTPNYETIPEPTPVDETIPEPTPNYETIPEPTPVDETTTEPTPVDETTPEPTPIDETIPEPTPVDETMPEPTPIDETTPEPTPVDETMPEPTPIDETTPEPTPVDETTAAPLTTLPTTLATTTTATTTSPYRTTIAPLSKLPLQFTVHVDSHYAPSCLDGDYFPVFVAPTPRNGVNLPAFVNQTLKIRVTSKAQYATIINLIITGPKGISKRQITTGDYNIEWTPTDDEANDHFPICFFSEAQESYRVYQSELRCVTVDVGRHEAIVTCNQTAIRVEVEKSYLIRRNEDNLHLNDFNDANCNLSTRSNRTHLVAVMSLNTCGTILEEDDDNIIYKNKITSADRDKIISRLHDVDIAFACVYPKITNLTLGFKHKNPYAFSEKGFGAFTFQFEFFESQRFRTQVDASTYPLEVYLKQMMFMQIEATTSIPNTVLFVESCKATPYDNPNSRISYTIIEHGCARDSTVEMYPSSRTQFRFGMEAFEFVGAHEEVYITCSVMLCENGAAGTRCSQGCIQSGSVDHRRRRAAVAETSRHSISQGPLHLVKTSDISVSGRGLTLGLNLVFIVGCLLVCGVVIYQSRRSKAKYQQLSTSETD